MPESSIKSFIAKPLQPGSPCIECEFNNLVPISKYNPGEKINLGGPKTCSNCGKFVCNKHISGLQKLMPFSNRDYVCSKCKSAQAAIPNQQPPVVNQQPDFLANKSTYGYNTQHNIRLAEDLFKNKEIIDILEKIINS